MNGFCHWGTEQELYQLPALPETQTLVLGTLVTWDNHPVLGHAALGQQKSGWGGGEVMLQTPPSPWFQDCPATQLEFDTSTELFFVSLIMKSHT